MPNWCSNSLKITPTNPESSAMLAKIEATLAEASKGGECRLFQTIHPMPDELTDAVCGNFGDEAKQAENEAKQKANIEKHGYPTWYEFANAEWGTKWDACELTHEKNGNSLVLWFDTAWSPPMAIYKKLEAIGFDVEATYCECGVGYAGFYRDGEDNEFNISFYDGEDEEDGAEMEKMEAFFQQEGFTHTPNSLGG